MGDGYLITFAFIFASWKKKGFARDRITSGLIAGPRIISAKAVERDGRQ